MCSTWKNPLLLVLMLGNSCHRWGMLRSLPSWGSNRAAAPGSTTPAMSVMLPVMLPPVATSISPTSTSLSVSRLWNVSRCSARA
ncbi:MAG: hypothetical protein ACYS5W_06270 [Planctomycetota bacterium]|jgi:hypothetical protein